MAFFNDPDEQLRLFWANKLKDDKVVKTVIRLGDVVLLDSSQPRPSPEELQERIRKALEAEAKKPDR